MKKPIRYSSKRFTPWANKVLKLAIVKQKQLKHTYVGVAHIQWAINQIKATSCSPEMLELE